MSLSEEQEQATPARPTPKLDWMQDCHEWGVKVEPGPHGLTMGSINTGIYGEIPDVWDEMTRMPRGAYPVEGVPRIDLYSLNAKVEVWADNAADLYEEAVQRRWDPKVDIDWAAIPSRPRAVELAMSQLCTELGQQAAIEVEVLGQWLHRMCYGYHEVKNFLATEAFDAARHTEAFRQRAVHGGGVLGLESAGALNRRLLEIRGGWTEAAVGLYIIRGTLTLLLYRYGEAYAGNAVDQKLFRLALQDKTRHMAYGMAHLKYAIDQKGSGYALGLKKGLSTVDYELVKELQDPVLWEALAILFGGGLEHIEAGMAVVNQVKQAYLEQSLQRLQAVGIDKSASDLLPALQAYLPPSE
ncbi:MAG: hypothetical protein ETSY1_11035 [Candidatus Entotheonella factor]|uniref:Ferritin-like domain-containing protein n=2 Tax=Candidatus Entotheonella TaxID=93171 RepID=W4LRH6_ENTF1|nr:MAG: hypothetical protein ETSY1_11035 [Candidatus Entotheonella factor]